MGRMPIHFFRFNCCMCYPIYTMIQPNVHIHKNKIIINCPNNNVSSEKYFKKGGKFKNSLTSITRKNINVGKKLLSNSLTNVIILLIYIINTYMTLDNVCSELTNT
jgi:hypothetical protein